MSPRSALAQRYGAVLQMYVSTGGEEALEEAQSIGREALESGVGPLVLFSMHRDVVQQLPPQPVEGDEFVSRITTVFIETLAPFQMSAGSFEQAQAQLTELGTIMHRHKQELDELRRKPGQEQLPQIHELQAMLERHAVEIEEVRARLGNTGRSPGTSRRMVADIVHIQEEERRRLVGEIHDDAVQAMTAVLLRIGLLGTRLEKPEQIKLAHELEENVRDAIARLRRLLIGLSPPELNRGGLGSAVRSALEQLKAEFQIDYTFDNRLPFEPDAETRTIAFRIIQEALANARKHAGATHVAVVLEPQAGGIRMSVTDDGIGFEVEKTLAVARPGHVGLTAMRERAELLEGTLSIESKPGETTVTFWLPLKREPDSGDEPSAGRGNLPHAAP